jgi:hypothetical protein
MLILFQAALRSLTKLIAAQRLKVAGPSGGPIKGPIFTADRLSFAVQRVQLGGFQRTESAGFRRPKGRVAHSHTR